MFIDSPSISSSVILPLNLQWKTLSLQIGKKTQNFSFLISNFIRRKNQFFFFAIQLSLTWTCRLFDNHQAHSFVELCHWQWELRISNPWRWFKRNLSSLSTFTSSASPKKFWSKSMLLFCVPSGAWIDLFRKTTDHSKMLSRNRYLLIN